MDLDYYAWSAGVLQIFQLTWPQQWFKSLLCAHFNVFKTSLNKLQNKVNFLITWIFDHMDLFMSLVMFNTFYYLLFFPPGCIFSCVLSFFSFPILFLSFFTHFHFHLWTLDPIWTVISTLTSLWPLWWPTFISGKTSGNCVPSVTATHRRASAFIHDSEASTHTGGTFDIQEFATLDSTWVRSSFLRS